MQQTSEELVEGAREELKRADHSIYVSLKYTRTVDIIKNIIKRLINAYDFAILEMLYYLKEKKKISDVPSVSKKRAAFLAFSHSPFKKDIDFYFFLREIDAAHFTKREEYRKNVALITQVNGKPIEVDIETVKGYFDRTVTFVDAVHALVLK